MFCKFIDGQVVDGSICMELPFTTTTQIIDGNEYESKIYDPDYFPIEIPAQPTGSDRLSYVFTEGKIVCEWLAPVDPLDRIATFEDIKIKQMELEIAPIDVFGYLIDCDPRSETFMKDAIETWEIRTSEPGVFEDVDGERMLYWKDSNNQYIPIAKSTLIGIYGQMKINRAIRAQKIWAKAQQYKASPPAIRVLNQSSLWLE